MIYFCNEEPLDLDFMRIMGASVKAGEDSIGMFGTGLKYAAAVIMRLGGKMSITVNGETHLIDKRPMVKRGQEFEVVTMDGEALPFMTKYGLKWEAWMAFRELYSNTLDEDGIITRDKPNMASWGTVIAVSEPSIEEAFKNREEYFPEMPEKDNASPEHSDPPLADVYNSMRRRHFAYAKGVAALHSEKPFLFIYNQEDVDLTEDRTVKEPGEYIRRLASTVCTSKNRAFIKSALLADASWRESTFDYTFKGRLSDEFIEVVLDFKGSLRLNQSAVEVVMARQPKEEPAPCRVLPHESATLDEALETLSFMGVELERDDFTVSEALGEGIMGMVHKDRIFISKLALSRGTRYAASTLYEEWAHLTHGVRDCTRDFQDLLLENLFMWAEHARRISK